MTQMWFVTLLSLFVTSGVQAQETQDATENQADTTTQQESAGKEQKAAPDASSEASATPLPLEEIELFAQVFLRIKQSYVEPVSDEQLLEYAVVGMLSGLDPHSVYLKNENYVELNESTTGAFTGLGMEVVMEKGFVKVIAPIDDTPAAKAGIQAGDLIIRIDGKTIMGLSLSEATEKMRGEPGTPITLTVLRETEAEPFDIDLKRAVVRVASVKRKQLSDDIGYLRVSQFQVDTAESFRKELKALQNNEKFAGLIIDLRNNPGGILTSAVSIADAFLTDGNIVSTKGRLASEKKEYNATATDLMDGKPIVVLINGGSASASEIVAGALQDQKRAIILGTESFGKGSVQNVLDIGENEAIKLTTARYYTPNGRSIQAAGIKPDVWVDSRQFKDREQGFGRIKENDLPNHLDGEELEKREGRGLSKETEELLTNDYQLNEAFNLMKGLVLFRK